MSALASASVVPPAEVLALMARVTGPARKVGLPGIAAIIANEGLGLLSVDYAGADDASADEEGDITAYWSVTAYTKDGTLLTSQVRGDRIFSLMANLERRGVVTRYGMRSWVPA